jgi:flagellar biosynthesis protein
MSNFSRHRNHAVAIAYGQEDEAPRILASGPGEIAKKIIELAKENGIPIKRDDPLVSVLSQFNAGDYVPESCYKAVAEIFAFLFRADLKFSKVGTAR